MLNDDYWYQEINRNTDKKRSSGHFLKTLCTIWLILSMLRITVLTLSALLFVPNINSYLFPLLSVNPSTISITNYISILAIIIVFFVAIMDVLFHLFFYKLVCAMAETAVDMKETKKSNQQMINGLHLLEITLVDIEELIEQKLK